MLRIHDILVWIRIRIRGSMPLTNWFGFGSGSFYFHHWPSRCQQKTQKIFIPFFCILLFEGTLTSFKIKSQKEVTTTLLLTLLHLRFLLCRQMFVCSFSKTSWTVVDPFLFGLYPLSGSITLNYYEIYIFWVVHLQVIP